MQTMSRFYYVFAIGIMHSIPSPQSQPQLVTLLITNKKQNKKKHESQSQGHQTRLIVFFLCSCSKPCKPLILAIFTHHTTEFTLIVLLSQHIPGRLSFSLLKNQPRSFLPHLSRTYSIPRTMLGGSADIEKMQSLPEGDHG